MTTQPLIESIDDIVARFSAAEPVPLIAADYGVTRTAIYLFIGRHAPGAKIARSNAKHGQETLIHDRYVSGERVATLAEDYGLSQQRIYEIIAKKRQDA